MGGGTNQYRDDASPEMYRLVAYINNEIGMDSKSSRVMALLNMANQKMGSLYFINYLLFP